MLLEPRLKSYQERIDSRLSELLPPETATPTDLAKAMRYACLSPGKRLRPILTMVSARACGPHDEERALDFGCAVEMVHCFSLIHDDLPALDNDDLRRGRPTLHKAFDEATAILAGDALFALAFETLSSSGSACGVLARACGAVGLVAGEVEDLQSEGKTLGADVLERIHRRKTAALLGASCRLGAIAAGATPHEEIALEAFGISLGLAFQIADDVLNETATAEQLGKAVGSDRDRQKLTYPAIFGLEESKRKAEEWMQASLRELAKLSGDTSELRELAEFSIRRTN